MKFSLAMINILNLKNENKFDPFANGTVFIKYHFFI